MKKNIVYILIVIVILIFGYFALDNTEPEVCFDETCFNVEIADEESERNKGLMFREELDDNKGMLFIFEQSGVYPFWMKNTPLPLDIIWIDSELKVVYIAKNTTPQSIDIVDPGSEAKYVLEINSGLSNKYEIKIGSNAWIKPGQFEG